MPSQVGQKRIKLSVALDYNHPEFEPLAMDSKLFEFHDLGEILLRTSCATEVAKKQILDKFGGQIETPEGAVITNISQFILREKHGDDKLMQVFRDDRSLNSYSVFDGKEIAIQLIPTEQVPADSCLIMVKLWHPSTWEISSTKHISVPKTATLDDFCTLVAIEFDIKEKEHLECCKIASCWNFNRVQLPHEQFYGLLSGETYMQAKPFFMAQDGLLFVVRQANEVLR